MRKRISTVWLGCLVYVMVVAASPSLAGCKTTAKDNGGIDSGSYDDSAKGDYYYEDYLRQKRERERKEREAREAAGKNSGGQKTSGNDPNNKDKKNSTDGGKDSGNVQDQKGDHSENSSDATGKKTNPENSRAGQNGKKDSGKGNNVATGNEADKQKNSGAGQNGKNDPGKNGNDGKNTDGTSGTGSDFVTNEQKRTLAEEERRKKSEEERLLEEEKRKNLLNVETYQFTIKKGERLKSFGAINGPGKDYHLIQSPVTGSKQYYYLADRATPAAKNPEEVKEKSLEDLKGLIGEEAYKKAKQAEADKNNKGTGFLEIVVMDSVFDQKGEKEIFYNPRFTNLKDMHKGNVLGFALFHNKEKDHLEIIYSVEGDLYRSYSKDGEHFEPGELMAALNSSFVERDPAISRDGKILVFASSRTYNSNLMGTQLFVSIRNSAYEDFPMPFAVKNATNSLNELFPTIFQSPEGTFIIFRKYDKCPYGYNESLYSIRMQGDEMEPMVPFSSQSDYSFKYITVSYSQDRGVRVMGSYPTNGYDIYRMYLTKEKILMKYALEDDCNANRSE